MARVRCAVCATMLYKQYLPRTVISRVAAAVPVAAQYNASHHNKLNENRLSLFPLIFCHPALSFPLTLLVCIARDYFARIIRTTAASAWTNWSRFICAKKWPIQRCPTTISDLHRVRWVTLRRTLLAPVYFTNRPVRCFDASTLRCLLFTRAATRVPFEYGQLIFEREGRFEYIELYFMVSFVNRWEYSTLIDYSSLLNWSEHSVSYFLVSCWMDMLHLNNIVRSYFQLFLRVLENRDFWINSVLLNFTFIARDRCE